MIFSPESIRKIIYGLKTQTRRRVMQGQLLGFSSDKTYEDNQLDCVYSNAQDSGGWRVKWQVGRDYAVQSGRGKPGVLWCADPPLWRDPNMIGDQDGKHNGLDWQPLRIRCLCLREEDVRKISHLDAIAEGFSSGRIAFWRTWCSFHDRMAGQKLSADMYDLTARSILQERPDARYRAWVMEFEVVLP